MKHIITLLTISTLVVLTGCQSAQLPEEDTNEAVVNTNTAVVEDSNTNTNEAVEVSEDVDTSDVSSEALAQEDWLTYENEEYGFSFDYPSEWTFSYPIVGDVEGLGYLDSPQWSKEFHLLSIKVDNVGLDFFQDRGETEATILTRDAVLINGVEALFEVGGNTLSESENNKYNSYMISISDEKTLTFFLSDDEIGNVNILKAIVLSLEF